jgi:hypothetical protein
VITPSPELAPEVRGLACVIRSRCQIAPILGLQPAGCHKTRKLGLNFDLNDSDYRAIGEALVERLGCLAEIAEDTTQTMSARRAASRELRRLMLFLRKLIEQPTGPLN